MYYTLGLYITNKHTRVLSTEVHLAVVLASFMSTRHKLESQERREVQLRKCLQEMVLAAC